MIENPPSNYLIDINDYKKINLINKGGFGSVYLVENKKTHQQFAAKVIESNANDKLNQESIDREIGILIKYPHPTIVKFYGFSLTDFDGFDNITIIMEYVKNGSLQDLINKSKNSLAPNSYNNTARQKILIGVACGMMHLHKHRIIHRDLKPGNILINENYHPLITDFGLSKEYKNDFDSPQSKFCGTQYYMAPEIFTSNKYNAKVDVYAFGIIMYSIITDCSPYSTPEDQKLKAFSLNNKIITENYRPTFTVHVKKSLKHLIERCWAQDPNSRPTFEDIFQKLAFNKSDSFYDFSDDDDDDDNDNANEDNDKNKYYLDGVDTNELNEYIEDILKIFIKSEDKQQLSQKSSNPTSQNNEKPSKTVKKIDELEENSKPLKEVNTKVKSNLPQKVDELKSQKIAEPKVKYSIKPSDSKGGILSFLKEKNSDEFDRSYIISLSSRDPYNLLLENWTGSFFSGDYGQFFIEFTLKEEIELIGIEIEGAGRNLMRSYEIFINDEKVPFMSVKDDTSMRDKNLTKQLFEEKPKTCKKVKIVPNGGNWDRDPKQKNFYSLRRIEFYTTKHRDGLIQFFRKSESDPHLFPIKIDSNRYSTEYIENLASKKLILTENQDGEFCDVKFIKGAVSVDGYRLKIKEGKYSLRGWKIVGKTINGIEKLIAEFTGNPGSVHVSDQEEIQCHEFLKEIRIYRTVPNNDGTKYLEFFHFDVFGNYAEL